MYGFMKTLRKDLAKREKYPTPRNLSVKPPRPNKKKTEDEGIATGSRTTRWTNKTTTQDTLLYLPRNNHQYLQTLSLVEKSYMLFRSAD
jgi:hypothetical protein